MDDTFNPDELLTTKQAAEYCGMDPRNITKAVTDGRLKYVKKGKRRQYWFTPEEVVRFNESRSDYVKKKKAVKATVSLSDLCIEPELEKLIAPLSDSEFQQLSDNCLVDGIRDPIITWNGTIVDGHNRFRIAQKLGLKTVPVKAIPFETLDDAKLWIVHNQLGRRNVSTYERCRLVLLLKDSVAADAEQRMLAGKSDPAQISAQGSTRDILANLAGVSHDTLTKVEKLERDADDALKAKLRSGSISINKAWKTLQLKKTQSDKNETTLLDTSNQSVDTSSAHTLSPVDNDTTPSVSAVVSSEPQASVSSQPSKDEISDSETSLADTIDFIKSDLGTLPSDLIQFVSSNDFYCDEEVLNNDWSHSFTAFVPEEFSNAFWQKFQQAGEQHALTKVVVFVQLENNTDIPCFNAITWVFSRYDVNVPLHVVVFDFTYEAT